MPKKTLEEKIQEKKEYFRQYRIDNKEAILEYHCAYNKANKQLIKEWRMTKIVCDCGRVISQGLICQHNKSDYHTRHVIAMIKKKLYG